KLRIGYVSADFRDHSVALLISAVLAAHSRKRFTVVCFTATDRTDGATEEIRRAADEWHSLWELDDDAACDLIERAAIDILVDLSGHTAGNRLGIFARKPAPIQVTWCGYPDTTGLTTIDFRITDAWCDPPGTTERLHSEELVRLPGGFVCYRPPEY